LTNAVTELAVGDGAVVDHYKLQTEGLEAFHIGSMFATLGRSANFTTTSISLGAALARHDVTATLSEGTEATLNGLYVAGGSQHVDNHTTIDHAKPHGSSRELYKGILDGKAHAVFNGRILVRQDAQKTDSKQTNKNLVLSDNATIDTKPELQIFADDVRCTHGATIGQLDAESLFYLQSRGIGRSDARRLLTYAFAQDIVDRIKVRSLRDSLERILFEKFHERS
jgi:Fe-S cluster assembly protein SufD